MGLVEAYRREVPVADWYAFREPLARMREGAEPDVLWPGVVRDFAQTSGTTAGDKFIPVSREMMRSNFRASLDIFAHLIRRGVDPAELFAGKALFIGGSSNVSISPRGIRTGDLSGLVTRLITWPLSEIYLPGARIALMSDWTAKIDAMAHAVWDQDVRFVTGMPSWGIVLFQRILDIARQRGIPARCLRDLWPNLHVFVHGGVNYAPFEPRVRQLWSGDTAGPDIPERLELYPASEGFVAMQDEPAPGHARPSLRLNTDIGLFFEFVPIEEIDAPDARAFTCDRVERGQRYVVVLSTCAGLWRYILGDVVEFDSIPAPEGRLGRGAAPPRLRIVGRHRHFVNAFGENLIVEHVERGVAQASAALGCVVGEFTAAPVYPAPGRRGALELAVELASPGVDLAAFARAFDDAVKAQNVDYTTKRKDDLGMGPPVVTPLPPGTFHRWLASRGKLGGQHKCPRCANTRDIIDSVLAAGRAP